MTDYALYLDDAGHPNDQPFLAVAGYVASESQWEAFESAWTALLACFSLGESFHMTDFMAHRNSELRRDRILYAISSTIRRYTIHPFVCGLDIAAYKEVNAEFALEECHGAPIALTARSVARQINIWKESNLGPNDHLVTFIEQGTKHYGDLEQVFKRDEIPIPTRVPKSIAAAQAADVLAWETFGFLRSRIMSKNLHRLTRSIRKKQELGGVLWEADLRRICSETDVYPRSQMRPGDTIRFHSERKRIRRRTIM